ncbi:MAG: hypothetical protein AABW56_03365 [Nanoarchaeota archaeon]
MLVRLKNKLKDYCIYIRRRRKNQPEFPLFLEVDESKNYYLEGIVVKAVPVGQKRTINFLSFHDMQEHALAGDFTNLKYLRHIPINAVYILQGTYKRLDECNAQISYQPMLVNL